jgi:hypothetical protein
MVCFVASSTLALYENEINSCDMMPIHQQTIRSIWTFPIFHKGMIFFMVLQFFFKIKVSKK